jgi:hypothetical protein
MSENVLSVIGDDPHWTPPPLTTEQATSSFRQFLPDAGDVAAETFACPSCAATLDQAWWAAHMDAAYSAESASFGDLAVLMPCCGVQTSLNDLTYSWPAGFASFALIARNPGRGWLRADELDRLSEIFGRSLRQVIAHY